MAKPLAIKLADLAALELEGLPSTRQGLNALAARAGWRVAGQARGGAYLYEVTDDLAEAIKQARRERLAAVRLPNSGNLNRRRAGRPKGSDYWSFNPDVADAVRLMRMEFKDPATTILEKLTGQFSSRLPHLRTLQRFIDRIEEEELVALERVRNPDLYKSKYRVSLGRADGGETYAHEACELDTTPTDVLLIGGRFAILGVIDRWSRRARMIIAPSESAQSVRALLARAAHDWGALPGKIIVDNGSGYVNTTVKTACELLGIGHQPCLPGSPERKPFVERLFGTFTRARSAMIPGFVGHNVADAQRLRSREKKRSGLAEIIASVTPEEFQAILDAWIIGVYEAREHSTTRQSPLLRAMSSPIPARAAPDADELKRLLSAFVSSSVVGKRGIRWKGENYWHPMLIEHLGKPVHVRRDEGDLGMLFVFDDQNNFICDAINWQRSGFSEQEFALAANHDQKRWEREQSALNKARKRNFNIEEAKQQVLMRDAEAAGKLAYFQPQKPASAKPVPAVALPPLPRATATVHTLPAKRSAADISDQVRRADSIIARHNDGFAIDSDQLKWAQGFVTTASYRSFKAAQKQPAQRHNYPINHRS